jgi:hypothetical protein
MVLFQTLIKNLFSTLNGHNITLSAVGTVQLMHYQQFDSPAYCMTSFQDGVAAVECLLCAPV